MMMGTEASILTRHGAMLISAIDRYSVLAYQITLLEIQKLAYFLQEAGEPLRLKHVKAQYGPYADNLNKVLETLEGHYISGFDGERSPEMEISLSDGATAEATAFLKDEAEAKTRLDRVGRLIEGFETPYGMELLSSVHFVAVRDTTRATDADDAVAKVHGWNDRKGATMKPDHILLAWNHLQSKGWIPVGGNISAAE